MVLFVDEVGDNTSQKMMVTLVAKGSWLKTISKHSLDHHTVIVTLPSLGL